MEETEKSLDDANSKYQTAQSNFEKLKERFDTETKNKQDLIRNTAEGQAEASKAKRALSEMKKKMEEKDEMIELCTWCSSARVGLWRSLEKAKPFD